MLDKNFVFAQEEGSILDKIILADSSIDEYTDICDYAKLKLMNILCKNLFICKAINDFVISKSC